MAHCVRLPIWQFHLNMCVLAHDARVLGGAPDGVKIWYQKVSLNLDLLRRCLETGAAGLMRFWSIGFGAQADRCPADIYYSGYAKLILYTGFLGVQTTRFRRRGS